MRPYSIAVIRALQKVEEWILSFAILTIAFLTIANVFARTVFNQSLAFAEELSQFLIIVVTFIGLSYAASQSRHIRMTAISDQLTGNSRRRLLLAAAIGTSLLLLILTIYAIEYVWAVYELGGVFSVTRLPFYIIYAVAPLGFAMAAVHYAAQALVVWNRSPEEFTVAAEPAAAPTSGEGSR